MKLVYSIKLVHISSFNKVFTNVFQFEGAPRTKAIMIIGNMLAIVQLSRLTSDKDFKTIKDTIKQELIKK